MSTDNRFGESEGGQVLILSVLFMTAIFMLGVFVVDLGLWVSERRVAQTAADMAAMAGAVSLSQGSACSGSASDPYAKAVEWATKNGYTGTDGATVNVTCSYGGDPNKILVEVSKPAPLLFASIFSLAGIDVGARAVSSAHTGAHFYAIFSYNSDCNQNGIQWRANGVTVTGDVHANGQLNIQGTGHSITGNTTYVCPPPNSSWLCGNCTYNPPPTQGGFLDWPVTYHASQFTCDFPPTGAGGSLDFKDVRYWKNNDPATNTLKSGVYCDSGTLNFSGSGSGIKSENCATTPPPCGVTFIGHAGVKLSGSGGDLWPYNGPHAPANANVLALCDPTSQGVPLPTSSPAQSPTPRPTPSPTPTPAPSPAPSPTPSPTPTPPPAGSCDIQMSGANGTWRGLLIDQYGTVDIQSSGGSGGNLNVVGALVGVTVKLNVQGFVLTGAYLPNTSNVSVALVE